MMCAALIAAEMEENEWTKKKGNYFSTLQRKHQMKRRVLISRKLLGAPALLDLIFALPQTRWFQYVCRNGNEILTDDRRVSRFPVALPKTTECNM